MAALSVCFYHFSRDGFIGTPWLHWIFSHGYLGVDAFFVISGFVIPLALAQTGFHLADTGTFLLSRFWRLYPAYFLAGVTAVGLWWVSSLLPGFKGIGPTLTPMEILGNAALLCDFIGTNWLIPVFWTLAIEAQYYALIALSYPMLVSSLPLQRYGLIAAWLGVPLLFHPGPTVFSWTALFAMGVLCFARKAGQISQIAFLALITVAFAIHTVVHDMASGTVGLMTGLAIAYLPELRVRWLAWVGTISYFLYLLHVIIGGRIINLAKRFSAEYESIHLLVVTVALLASIFAAAVFFYFIEKPSHEYARKLRQRLRQTTVKPAV